MYTDLLLPTEIFSAGNKATAEVSTVGSALRLSPLTCAAVCETSSSSCSCCCCDWWRWWCLRWRLWRWCLPVDFIIWSSSHRRPGITNISWTETARAQAAWILLKLRVNKWTLLTWQTHVYSYKKNYIKHKNTKTQKVEDGTYCAASVRPSIRLSISHIRPVAESRKST